MATFSGGGGETTGGQPHLAKQDLSTLVRARVSERERGRAVGRRGWEGRPSCVIFPCEPSA